MTPQSENPTQLILNSIHDAKKVQSGWSALCPAHNDQQPSLSIREGSNGECLIHCHAGCTPERIMNSLGLELKHLYPSGSLDCSPNPGKQSVVAATYDYCDASGNLIFQVVRYEPKTFRQRRPDGNGGYIWDMKGQNRVLYNLPGLKKAIAANHSVFVVEGEKDAESLTRIGQCATCNVGGAGKWLDSYNEALGDADVVILPDNDEPGRQHAEWVAKSLQGYAKQVKVLELPDLPEKGDVSDWLDAGGSIDELLRLVDETPVFEEPINPTKQSSPATFPCTDFGNSERFIAIYGRDVKYVADWNKWIYWDEFRYTLDEIFHIELLGKNTIRSIYAEAANAQNDDTRKELAKWARSSESAQRLQNMLTLARSMLAIVSDLLDTDQYLLCVKNGTLDLRTGYLLAPLRDHLITKQTPIIYDPVAQCPTFMEFLERVQPDPKAREYLQRCFGYSLSGDISEHCVFFMYGEGRNGKSVTLEILKALVGREYFKKIDAELLMNKSSRNAAETKADLIGKRVVSTTEIGEGQRLNEALIKDMTGGDTQDARKLYCQSRDFVVKFHIWLYGNHKPTIRGNDLGIWSRIRLIPFSVVIPEAEQDKHLIDKLHLELPGILNWAVEGFMKWQKDGLQEPDVILDATNEYRKEQDSLQEFLADYCVIAKNCSVSKKSLWDAYQTWTKETGEDGYDSQRLFNDEIRRRPGIKDGRLHAGAKAWNGIGLMDKEDRGPDKTSVLGDQGDQGDQVSTTFSENILHGKSHENTVTPVTPVSHEAGDTRRGMDIHEEDYLFLDADDLLGIGTDDLDSELNSMQPYEAEIVSECDDMSACNGGKEVETLYESCPTEDWDDITLNEL